MAGDFKPHLFVKKVHTTRKYQVPRRKIDTQRAIPDRNRKTHGAKIKTELTNIWNSYNQDILNRRTKNLPVKNGEYLTFKSASDNNLNLKALDSSGAHLLCLVILCLNHRYSQSHRYSQNHHLFQY